MANGTLRIIATTLLLVAAGTSGLLLAGLGTTTGQEQGRWTEDRYSVVVARVLEVAELSRRPGPTHRAVLEPLATLAGALDPSERPTLTVTFYAAGQTSIREVPPQQGTVIAVLQGDTFIVSDICPFMPGRTSLATVTGMYDPKVVETADRLRAARASVARPATKPVD